MKKGFTLIELLSVIVVIAIISIIAVPTLIGVVNKAKLGALKSSAYGLIEASNLYYAQYQNSNNIRFDIDNNKVVSSGTTNKLKYKGTIKEGVAIIKGNGKTVVCITDGKNSAYKNYDESKVSLVSGKKCTIPDNSSIVYLDGEATMDSVDAKAILDKLDEMQNQLNEIKTLATNNSTVIGTVNNKVDTVDSKVNTASSEISIIKNTLSQSGGSSGSGQVIKYGTITATTTIDLGQTIDPSKYVVNIHTNAYTKDFGNYQSAYSQGGANWTKWAFGYGQGAYLSAKTSTSCTITVSTGITASYEIVKIG